MNPKSVDKVNKKSEGNAEEIFEMIHAIMHLTRSEQYRVLRDGPHDLTHMEGKILGFFAWRPGATLSELVAHSGRDKGQLARLIKTLKDYGLLVATADKADRRNVRLQLSPEGKAVHETLQRQLGHVAKISVAGLNSQERRQLIDLLHKVHANLEAAIV